MIKPAITLSELIKEVEILVKKDKMTYAEAIIEICNKREIEPEDMAKLMRKKSPLKNKLEAEAKSRNIIKSNTATLF